MKKTYYLMKNVSGSEGTYLLDGKYLPLYPGEEKVLDRPPVNKTANIMLSTFKRDVGSGQILNKKPQKKA